MSRIPKGGTLKIRLNGEPREIEYEMTIDNLLHILNLSELNTAVELNLDIIDKKDYAKIRLKEGDVVEIISFVGGGQYE